MKSRKQVIARSMRIAALPLLLIAAGLCGQSVLAGGNSSGQPSGTTVAGSTTTPPAAMSALTGIVMSGTPVNSTTTTSTSSTGVTTTTRTVSMPASALTATFSSVGLSLPAAGASQTYVGSSGATFTVTNNNGTITIAGAVANAGPLTPTITFVDVPTQIVPGQKVLFNLDIHATR